MNQSIAYIVSAVFIALALWHVRMAFSSGSDLGNAVPTVDGRPLFVPSRRATLAVAVVLLLFAGLVAATSGAIALGVPKVVLRWMSYVLASGLLVRAVGDFKYVGLFKRVRGSRFATLDTLVYSPLCLLLSIGVALVAMRNGV